MGVPRGGPKEPLMLQVLRRSPHPRGGPPQPGGTPPIPWGGGSGPPLDAGPPLPPPSMALVDSGTQTDISFESRLGGGEQ